MKFENGLDSQLHPVGDAATNFKIFFFIWTERLLRQLVVYKKKNKYFG